MQDILTGCDGWTAAGAERCAGKSQLREECSALGVFARFLSICEWEGERAEDVKSTRSGGSVKIGHQLKVSTMTAIQLLFPLLVSCVAASARPPRHLSACQVVQMDVFCSNLNLRSAPVNLPHGVQMLDLSLNQVQNLTMETLAYHTSFNHLNLHSNKIHFIQPGLFRDMTDLKVLDLSRNHLNVFTHSKINIGPLTAVESLDLSSNGLYTGMSDYFLADSPSLANLSLNSNSITKIAQNTFSGSSSLKRINLHNNVILEIEDGAFDSLNHLTELDLSKNSITCITDFNLCHLKVLNLSKNSMEFFQSTRSTDSYDLQILDLSENKMHYFPLLPRNNVLQYLDVSRNQLQSINVTASHDRRTTVHLFHLRYLDMSYNQLQIIHESFFYCMASLEVLNVSNNCISSFSITNEGLLQTVKVINLSYNSLQSLTFGENTLPSLEELLLQGNDLTNLDHQIFQKLPSIKHLYLQENDLEICDADQNCKNPPACVSFSSIPNLQFLYISENNLQTLPSNAFANTPLKLLDLSLNPGLDMDRDSFSGLERSLVHLLLRENNISCLNTDLSSLKSLKHIDLSTNQLTTLPMWNRESSIESLNLQNNNLVTLEPSTMLALEHSLKTLYMGSNPLSCCSNLAFLQMVKNSALTIADLETVTCVLEDYSEPVNIGKVTEEMCQKPKIQNFVVVVVLTALFLLIVLGLLIKCCQSKKRKPSRRFNA
ncbi:transforming growth factor beta activator LRRC32 [Labrus bergylta]|uniref:Leucine rich repeat containing 32 n=1 Tax=Labrus bergylta TaxID=56723 RepID=A0A3Q3NID8_9LABR|nr:transforming growth factor beta activator LRRC32-like isoform X1 [Labrus bergylta]